MKRLAIVLMLPAIRIWSEEPPKPPPDPRILSVHPCAVRAGVTTQLAIRGTSLSGARALLFKNERFTARVLDASTELVHVEVTPAASGEGSHPLRLVSPQGVSNEFSLQVVAEEVAEESSITGPLSRFPVVVAGRIGARGEVDSIWFEAKPGDTLTFTSAAGAPGFDPSLVLAEPSGSWFEEGRLNRIAFNDEPLYFPGLSADARLVHRFERGGKYAIQVRAFSGQGGPDFTYRLRISPGIGEAPSLHPRDPAGWEERQFTRKLPADWTAKLVARGGRAVDAGQPAIFRATAGESAEPPVVTVPGLVEGRIGKPAEAHRFRLRIGAPQDLAIEVETPEATMPRFNPVVRLIAPDGGEVVTNVYTKRNNNGLYMMKMIQAKSTFTLRSAGDYLMEVRDITTDVSSDDFAYRILVRQQIPHVGKIEVAEDRLNLEPGQAKALTVNMEREEGFAGLVLISAEGLPSGVTATMGLANPVEKPPLPNGGRLERYVGKPQTATLILSAAQETSPLEMPARVRVFLRTVIDGRQSGAIFVKEIPVMVIPRRPS